MWVKEFSLLQKYRSARGPPNPILNSFLELFPWRRSSRDEKLTSDLPLVQVLRMSGAVLSLPPVRIHGVDMETFTFFTVILKTIMIDATTILIFVDSCLFGRLEIRGKFWIHK